ncbi:g8664 [Coccomyxa elongata]
MQLPLEEELHEMIADPKKKRSARTGKHAAALGEYRKELVRLEKEIGIDYHRAAYTDRQRAQLVGWEDIDVFPADDVFHVC